MPNDDSEFIPRISGETIQRGIFPEKLLSYINNKVPKKHGNSYKLMLTFQRKVMDAVDADLISIVMPGRSFSSHIFERESFIKWFIASGAYDWIRSFRWRGDDIYGISDPFENQSDFIEIHRKLDSLLEQNNLFKLDIAKIDPTLRNTEEILSLLNILKSHILPTKERRGPKSTISKKDYPDFKKEVHRLISEGVSTKMIPYRATITKFFAPGVKNDGKKKKPDVYFRQFTRHYRTIIEKVKKAKADKSE